LELKDIIAVNWLYGPFYPYLARQVMEVFGRASGRALELGPYAPGISIALLGLLPGLEITIADDTPGIHAYFQEALSEAGLAGRTLLQMASVEDLPYPNWTFDLIYFRGGLFFGWDPVKLLRETDRLLRPGGIGLIGGGFGAGAPDSALEAIADEARELNRRLGKKGVSEKEAEDFAREAGVVDHFALDTRHGLWILLRRPPT
jgi:SAM-dependent methyltransferase